MQSKWERRQKGGKSQPSQQGSTKPSPYVVFNPPICVQHLARPSSTAITCLCTHWFVSIHGQPRSDRVFALIFLATPCKNANKLTSAGRWCCRTSSMLRGARCSVVVLISWRCRLCGFISSALVMWRIFGYVHAGSVRLCRWPHAYWCRRLCEALRWCCDNDLEYAELREDKKRASVLFFF